MDLIVTKTDGSTKVYDNATMLGIKPEDNMLMIVGNHDTQYTLNLDEIDEYYFEDKKVKALYAVVNMKNTDRYGLPTFVKFGYDLEQLMTTYHGESYKIFDMGEI